MTNSPSGGDPVIQALDRLVRSGKLAPERARAAYEASRGNAPSGPPAGSKRPTDDADRSIRPETVVVAIGATFLATTIALSAAYARAEGDLDWSNYALGILATLGLLGLAAGAMLLVRDEVRQINLAAWPGALGAIGVGVMLGVGIDDSDVVPYVGGLATAGLGALGYFVVRRGAFVVASIVGLLAAYAKAVDDVVGVGDTDGNNFAMTAAAALTAFAIVVTAAGWRLPARDLAGVFVGALTVVGFSVVLTILLVVVAIQEVVGGLSAEMDGMDGMDGMGGGPSGPDPDRFNNDVYLILLFTAILVAGWALCGLATGHVGYRVLILVMVTTVVPTSATALAVEHPSWWGLGFGIVGAGVLGAAGIVSMRSVSRSSDGDPGRGSGERAHRIPRG